ncbi:phosphoethanolamine transferase [Psittacicella hinzii]|uniref:phosphoethanolamine transferase n=1 Tax=Psittacicella hinzii TaxID=2028575 RepID=UPI001CA7227F|nr:phosphoethanolamine transferase [Psittacicella hinzii]
MIKYSLVGFALTLIAYAIIGKITKLEYRFKSLENYEKTHVFTFFKFADIYLIYKDYQKLTITVENLNAPPTFKIAKVQNKYHDYVIILGESARPDIFSVYGFAIKTSPYLEQVKGTIYNGYVSVAASTAASINYSFIYHQDENYKANAQDTVINIAKHAGFSTAWLSVQSKLTRHDSAATLNSQQADYSWFPEYYNNQDKYDKSLLPLLEKYLNSTAQDTKPRLIVLHTNGSHPDAYSRLYEEVEFDYVNKNLSCYLQTIKQTDNFISQVVDTVSKHSNSYSVMYFSDHGIEMKNADNPKKATTTHSYLIKEGFEIPLVVINSDDTEHREVTFKQSNINFIAGFSQWLGITYSNIAFDDFWQGTNDPLKVIASPKWGYYDQLRNNHYPQPNTSSISQNPQK